MKATELINELQKLIKEHGDLPVNVEYKSSIYDVCAYTIQGHIPTKKTGIAVEFYLHDMPKRGLELK